MNLQPVAKWHFDIFTWKTVTYWQNAESSFIISRIKHVAIRSTAICAIPPAKCYKIWMVSNNAHSTADVIWSQFHNFARSYSVIILMIKIDFFFSPSLFLLKNDDSPSAQKTNVKTCQHFNSAKWVVLVHSRSSCVAEYDFFSPLAMWAYSLWTEQHSAELKSLRYFRFGNHDISFYSETILLNDSQLIMLQHKMLFVWKVNNLVNKLSRF